MDVTNAALQRRLDAVDSTSRALRELRLDAAFQSELQGVVPQFVAVGNQSAGKSSLLRRVGKIPLPDAVKRCTRLPILLQLRRVVDAEASVRVQLTHAEGDVVSFTREDGDVLAAVTAAQAEAVSRAKSEFAKDYVVEVTVHRPDVPNVTLVDLPGFFDPDTHERADAEAVFGMAERFIDMQGTLVLHVVGADQDYGSVLRKEKLGAAAKTVPGKVSVVLTKLDLLEKQGTAKARASFEDTRAKIDAKCFAVLGASPSDDDEEAELRGLCTFSDGVDIGWGVRALNVHLEERIAEHLDAQMPKARAKLEVELRRAERELEGVKKREPSEVLAITRDAVREHFERGTRGLQTRVHVEIVRFARAMRFLVIRPLNQTPHGLGGDQAHCNVAANAFTGVDKDAALEEDDVVWLALADKARTSAPASTPTRAPPLFKRATLPGSHGWISAAAQAPDSEQQEELVQAVVVSVRCNADGEEIELLTHDGETISCARSQLRLPKGSAETFMEQLERVVSEQGLRNLGHADPQHPLELYMADFADRYAEAVGTMMRNVRRLVWEAYEDAFKSPAVPDVGEGIVGALRAGALGVFRDLDAEASAAVDRFVAWNKAPLVFTTNEHYLLQNYRSMLEWGPLGELAESLKGPHPNVAAALGVVSATLAPPTDKDVRHQAAAEVHAKLKAYWKVQVKQVTEAAAKEACRIYLVLGGAKFKTVSERVPPSAVRETTDRERRRGVLDHRVKVLRRALEELDAA